VHSAFKNIVNNMHYTPSSRDLLLLVVNGWVLLAQFTWLWLAAFSLIAIFMKT